MSLLDLYPEMWADRCSVQAVASGVDPSGGRADTWPVTTAGIACSVQPASDAEITAANALGVKVETKVYFPNSPGDLRPNSRIQVNLLSGVAPTRSAWMSVTRIAREGLADLIVWRVDCVGRP